MKILVPVKRVIDHKVNVRVRQDRTGVETANVKMSMNPFDEIAVEEAVRAKETGSASEVVVVSIGPKQAEDVLRTALAMGADRAVHIEDEVGRRESLAFAKLISKVAQEEQVGLILLGKQAIDSDAAQTGPMVAGLLGWAQATFAAKIEWMNDVLKIVCEADQGRDEFRVPLPAVVSVDLQLNQPRKVALPNVMKARSKPLNKRSIVEFEAEIAPQISVISTREPEPRAPVKMLSSIDELAASIHSAMEGTK